MFPVIADVGTLVIPDFERITKLPADPRLTGVGVAANRAVSPVRPSTKETTNELIKVPSKNRYLPETKLKESCGGVDNSLHTA